MYLETYYENRYVRAVIELYDDIFARTLIFLRIDIPSKDIGRSQKSKMRPCVITTIVLLSLIVIGIVVASILSYVLVVPPEQITFVTANADPVNISNTTTSFTMNGVHTFNVPNKNIIGVQIDDYVANYYIVAGNTKELLGVDMESELPISNAGDWTEYKQYFNFEVNNLAAVTMVKAQLVLSGHFDVEVEASLVPYAPRFGKVSWSGRFSVNAA